MAKRAQTNERWWWKHLYEQGERSARRRRQYNREFREMFPKGHKESIREVVGMCKAAAKAGEFEDNLRCEYLRGVHPDAFDILAKYGTDYTPRLFKKPAPFGEPAVGECYMNSLKLMVRCNRILDRHPRIKKRTRFVYVEGIAVGPIVNPMAHGWCARGLNGRKAIDWTLYATSKWTRYLGIPFTLDELTELAKLTGRGNIFEKRCLNRKAKKRLIEILEARKNKKRKGKKKLRKATR
jgi:hypothetical protein